LRSGQSLHFLFYRRLSRCETRSHDWGEASLARLVRFVRTFPILV
jgi:hypothetical protein